MSWTEDGREACFSPESSILSEGLRVRGCGLLIDLVVVCVVRAHSLTNTELGNEEVRPKGRAKRTKMKMNVSEGYLGLLGPFNWIEFVARATTVRQSSVDRAEQSVWASVCGERVRAVCDERSWYLSQANGLRRFATRFRAQNEFDFARMNHSHGVDFTGTHLVRNPKKKEKEKKKKRRRG